MLKFNSESFEFGKTYRLDISTNYLLSFNGLLFQDNSSELELSIENIPSGSISCNNHGRVSGIVCICYNGYKGHECAECDFGFFRTAEDLCEKTEENKPNVREDPSAFVKIIFDADFLIIPHGNQIEIKIELTQQAFNENGHLIDALTNSQYLESCFILKKIKRDLMIKPFRLKSLDSKGLK